MANMLDKMRNLRRLACAAGVGLAFTLATDAQAAKPSPQAALELAPVQKDVQYERPAKDQVEKCTIDTITSDKVSGWVVRDSSGQVLRRFLDTNKDNKLDQWCYFRDGIEVYRDLDTDFNGKADQYRWLGTAGIRWGVDEDEDGKIDAWRMISPEEVTSEVVSALRDRDVARFERLLMTDAELKGLGLSESQTKDLGGKLTAARAGFAELARRQKMVGDKTVWTNFGATQPGMLAAGADDNANDLVVYENVAAVIETDGKHAQLAVGTLVQVDRVWRLIDLPSNLVDDKSVAASGGYFFNVLNTALARPAGSSGEVSAETQKLTEELDSLERALAKTTDESKAVELNTKRIELLEKLYQAASGDEERGTWLRQLADTISTAVQSGAYPEGVKRLEAFEEKLRAAEAKQEYVSYVRFRLILAQYSVEVIDPQGDPAAIQSKWIENLETFINDFPQTGDTPDAMLQLAIAKEFANKTDDALKWYGQIVSNFGTSEVARKAAGAKLRLESVGQVIPLKAKTLDGKTVDLASFRGQVVLIHYWTTTCEPCKAEMVKLRELQAKYAKQKLAIIGVNLDYEAKAAADFAKAARLSWPQLFEPGGLESRLATEMGVAALPLMLLVDADGRVANRSIHAAELDGELAKRFKEPGAPTAQPPRSTAGPTKAPPRK